MSTARRPAARPSPLKGRLSLETPLGAVLGDSRIRLLEAIGQFGSLNRAARAVPLSYKAAWDALDAMNAHSPQPLVVRSTGGAGGGGTTLTDYARQLIALYRAMESSQQDVLDRLPALPDEPDAPTLRRLLRRMTMRSSARNQYACEVLALADRGGRVDVALGLLDAQGVVGERIVAAITPESVREMALAPGGAVHALIKAPWVELLLRAPRRAAGRNLLTGPVTELRPGRSRWGVALQLAGGLRLEASVPAARARTLAMGQPAWGRFAADSVVLVSFG